MRKELSFHLITTIILFILIFIFRYLNIHLLSSNLFFLPFLIGGLVGAVLPDIDHLIYVYYLRPYEVTSMRVINGIQNRNWKESWDLLSTTRSERTNLILHTILFQLLFLVLSFLVITSSTSLFGRGLVLAFLLHLFIDEILDLKANGNLLNWFKNIPFELDKSQINIYLVANFVIILVFGFLM